jgi:hypothetical protein
MQSTESIPLYITQAYGRKIPRERKIKAMEQVSNLNIGLQAVWKVFSCPNIKIETLLGIEAWNELGSFLDKSVENLNLKSS